MNDRPHPIAPTKHSMKRRAPWHDYRSPGTYMLTMAVEGRRPLLGRLVIDNKPGETIADHGRLAHVVPSPFGEAIRSEVAKRLRERYPQVEVWRLCIMPDHIHMIVRVKTELPDGKHLGHVVAGFKRGCYKAAQTLGVKLGETIAENSTPFIQNMTPFIQNRTPAEKKHGENEHPVPCDYFAGQKFRLFESGYNDRLLFDGEQLARWKHYLDDNPRRLAIKRLHPDLFTVKRGFDITGRTCRIIGNHFLLDIPDKVAVIYHRRYTEAEFQRLRTEWLSCGERGGVLVSAAIHPNEKAVMREAMDSGYHVILLRENGFSEYYKPSGEAFDACSRGQLLQVSPWEYHTRQATITREQCLMLNDLAEAIVSRS